jgi:hypothetical protein
MAGHAMRSVRLHRGRARLTSAVTTFIKWFREIRLGDVPRVGGKTASLGELYGELGRDRDGLRGRAVRGAPGGGPGRDAEDRDQGDAQCRQSGRGLPARRPAQRRRGAGACRVHHRELRAVASTLHPDRVRDPAATDRWVRGPRGVLRGAAGRRGRDDRGGLLSQGRDRPPLRLQVQRVRGARGRSGLRARGRQSHARLPRRVPATRTRATGRPSSSSAGPCAGSANRWGSSTRS